MIFQRLNAGDPERVFGLFYNVQGATITAGYAARLDTGTFDGVRISQPTTATFSLLAGVANASIADSSYGLVQVYGFRQSAFVTNDTSVAVAAGDILVPVNAVSHFARQGAGNATVIGGSALVVIGEAFATATTPAAAAKKVFIRAM
jgi:hypothetical protein